jgi:hypothetical protein
MLGGRASVAGPLTDGLLANQAEGVLHPTQQIPGISLSAGTPMHGESRFDAANVVALVLHTYVRRLDIRFADATGTQHVVSLPMREAVDLANFVSDSCSFMTRLRQARGPSAASWSSELRLSFSPKLHFGELGAYAFDAFALLDASDARYAARHDRRIPGSWKAKSESDSLPGL